MPNAYIMYLVCTTYQVCDIPHPTLVPGMGMTGVVYNKNKNKNKNKNRTCSSKATNAMNPVVP